VTRQSSHPALTDHASQRSLERVAAEGLAVEPLIRLAIAFAARYSREDIAVRLYHGSVRDAHGDTASTLTERGSNGEDLWAVARQGAVISLFWRRAAQPVSPDRFEVCKVFMKGWAH
jgi:hypothetical protein